MLGCFFTDIDFTESHKLPVKFEPQWLHWCHEAMAVVSGMVKLHLEKSYNPYVSDNNK